MPIQGRQVTISSTTAFDFTPNTGDPVSHFDRVVISNQSGYQLQIAAGAITFLIEPWTKDIVPTYRQKLVIRPIVVSTAQIAPGVAAYIQSLWILPQEDYDASALPVTISTPPVIAGSTPGVQLGTSKTFWSGGIINLSVTNTDTVYNMNFHSGWGSAVVNANKFTVPAGKQLVITNGQVCTRPGTIAYQVHLRSATTPLTTATEMYVVTMQPDAHFGAPASGVDLGGVTPMYFGESSFVLPAGSDFCMSVNCGAASAFMDAYFAGFLQDVST